MPQAMRSPAFPAGSVFISSALAWIIRAVPPPAKTEFAPSAKGHARIFHGHFRRAIRLDHEILHVAGVRAVGILEAMLLHIGVEMAARGGELRAFALGVLMDVNSMFARRQVL